MTEKEMSGTCGTFSITPEEIASTACAWRMQGTVVAGLDFAPLARVTGEGTRTFAAIRSCDAPAKDATDSIGARLTTLGERLHLFTVTTVDNDRAIAESFANLTPR